VGHRPCARMSQSAWASGFTDDRAVQGGSQRFADNLEVSAQRALTVTRVLIEEDVPSSRVFSAAFGAEQPVASNADEKGRALNRRVEMAPVPKAPLPKPAAHRAGYQAGGFAR